MIKPDQPIGHFCEDSGLWLAYRPWKVDLGDLGTLLVLPGFESDGASIPRLLWSAVGPRYCASTFPAALCHDALYAANLLTRKQADKIFYCHLRMFGVGRMKAATYYRAVRWFGGGPWRKDLSEILHWRQYVMLEEAA